MESEVLIPLDVLTVILAVILPMLTALVSARFANSSVKTLVLLALTIIATGLQTVFDDGGRFEAGDFVTNAAVQFLMAVGFHFGLLKPTGVTGANGKVAQSVPAGVGGPSDRVGPQPD